MDLIRREAVLEILENGKVTIDEDILDCQNAHEVLVYLLKKIEEYLEDAVGNIPSVEAVPVENIKRIVEWLEEAIDHVNEAAMTADEADFYPLGKESGFMEAIRIVKEEGGLNERI